jgi:hypothetical protein
MGRRVAAFTDALRAALARERLPPEPPAETGSATPGRARRPLRGLLAPEPLPLEPTRAPPARGRGLASLLFAHEPLPSEPSPPRPRRGRWLAWLLAPEPLGRPPDPPEVP